MSSYRGGMMGKTQCFHYGTCSEDTPLLQRTKVQFPAPMVIHTAQLQGIQWPLLDSVGTCTHMYIDPHTDAHIIIFKKKPCSECTDILPIITFSSLKNLLLLSNLCNSFLLWTANSCYRNLHHLPDKPRSPHKVRVASNLLRPLWRSYFFVSVHSQGFIT